MEITSQADGSSPLATFEDIRNRLVRPPSLRSQSSTRPREDAASSYLSLFDANSTKLKRKTEDQGRSVANKRLEDYLDPTLLAAARTEINRKRGGGGGGERKSKDQLEFRWPVEELKAWTEDWRREKRKSDGENYAVDLGDDGDETGGGGDREDEAGRRCSPFRRFEGAALKRFQAGEG